MQKIVDGKTKVLVVDDQLHIVLLLQECFTSEGYEVVAAANGVEGLRQFFEHRPDLVILDILMPKMDGLELCRRIREVSSTPIIFLSVKGTEIDKERGLLLGGDDYVIKPFSVRELQARVKAVLRRAHMVEPREASTVYCDEILTIDLARHQVQVRGANTVFTPMEYRLLVYLVQNAPCVLSLEQILKMIWGPEYESPENIKGYISRLRRKIEIDPEHPILILTVRGVGYRYERPAKQAA